MLNPIIDVPGSYNTLQFKIDKRSQIVMKAQQWVDEGYPFSEAASVLGASGAHGYCDAFTNVVYGQMGLQPIQAFSCGLESYGALVPDNGSGALLFYWYKSYANNSLTSGRNPNHASILNGSASLINVGDVSGDRYEFNGPCTQGFLTVQSGGTLNMTVAGDFANGYQWDEYASPLWWPPAARCIADPNTGGSLLMTLDTQ